MKRLHIHIGVEKLEEAIHFYTALFGTAPVKTKPDYAKWLLDDPQVNFAISTRVSKQGLDHLGIQVDDALELTAMRERLSKVKLAVYGEGETVCCYARSEKTWVQDAAGLLWEVYRTMDDADVFSGEAGHSEKACCTPEITGPASADEHSPVKADCCLS